MRALRSRGRRRRRSRGQSLVEFSLVVPIFFLVFLGVAEGGYFVVAGTIVSHATHEGARYGVLESTPGRAAVRARVQAAAAPVVDLDTSAITLLLDDAAANDAAYDARVAGQRLMVRTDYTHTPLLGYVFEGLSFPADAETEMIVEG